MLRRLTRLLILGSALVGTAAHASFITYYLSQTNANPTLSDNVDYAKVMIDDNTANTLTFTVSLLGPLTGIAASNFGIQEFGFNVLGNSMPLSDASGSNAQWGLPSGWSASVAPPPNQLDGFGRFEVSVSTTGTGRLPTLVFGIVGTGLNLFSFAENSSNTAGEGNTFFAAHIAGFAAGGGITSAYFGGSSTVPTAVPIPAAGLLPAGMAVFLAFMRRRRADRQRAVAVA